MKINLFKISKWASAWLATASLVVAPLAQAKEAQNITMQVMQAAMDQMGLNKSMTFGQFYEQNKNLYPPRIQKELEPVVAKYKNQKMPQFELVSSKGTDGLVVPTIRMSQGNELINMQWFGEPNKFVKVQNTNLTQIDLINFNDMVVRVLAGDENMRKGVQPLRESKKIEPTKRGFNFAKYPDLNERDWKQMSDFDRASYIVNLRLLWLDAEKVLNEKRNGKAKKTSQNFFEKNEKYFEFLIGQEALAAAGQKSAIAGSDADAYNGGSCIVAGYVAHYDKKDNHAICDYALIEDRYTNTSNKLYTLAKTYCDTNSPGRIPCNPYVFGAPGGAPNCIDPKAASFQTATHYNEVCDKASRLQSSETPLALIKKDLKEGRYDESNMIPKAERDRAARSAEEANNFKLTEEYLLGVLKLRGDTSLKKDATSIFEKDGTINKDVFDQIVLDKKAFDKEIEDATKSCKIESDNSKEKKIKHEKNYWPACDQLQRRYLQVEFLFSSKCGMGSTINTDSLKCQCKPSGQEVLPGAKCGPPIAALPISGDVSKTKPDKPEKKDCRSLYGSIESELDLQCKCNDGSTPKEVAAFEGRKVFSCKAEDTKKEVTKKDEPCGFGCSFMKNLPQIAIGLAVAGGIYWFLNKYVFLKKPALQNPGDGCPVTGLPAPCATTCVAPLATTSAGCACPACPPGQTNSVAASCQCSGTAAAAVTLMTCPDGIAKAADITQCPYHTCSTTNPPTSFQNPANCPTVSTSGATPAVNGSR